MHKAEHVLTSLGLNNKQSAVYIALLTLGEATAYEIANKSGLKRPTVYVILEELRQKDLVLKIPNIKKQVFIAKDPRELIAEEKQKILEAEAFLPKLLALAKRDDKPDILYYEGYKGMIEAFTTSNNEFAGKEIVGFYAHSPDAPPEFVDIVVKEVKKLGKSGSHVRSITPDHISTAEHFIDLHKEFGWEMKRVPLEKYSSLISIEVSGEIVRIISRQKGQTILIRNHDIAHALKQIFEIAWMSLP